MKEENKQKRLDEISDSKFELMLLEHTLNGIGECIAIADISNNILFSNKAFCETYGYTREEILGANIKILNSPKNDSDLLDLISKATMNGGWKGELYNRKKNGDDLLIDLKTSLIKNDEDEPIAFISSARDITEEVKTRQALKLVEDKYSRLFMELKDTVFESTPDGHMIDINPAGLELFGYNSIEEIRKANIGKDLYESPSDRERFIEKLEKDGFVKNFELRYKKSNGEIGTLLESAFVVKDEEGKVQSYRGILRDITDIKRVETELKNMNASKDKFFSIIAHDLRSPFGSLLSFSEFLVEDLEELTPDEIKLFAEKINESSKAVFKLLDNLLQWSRMQTGRMEFAPANYDLFSIVNQTINILLENAKAKNISLHNETVKDTLVYADENMINSIFQNLISNAIKFTKPEGGVTITSKLVDDMVEISIIDTGVGIDAEDIGKLFNIDVHISKPGTANEEGTGLGLILCKEMVNKNGGDISVSSAPGEGATFTFTLPVAN